MSFEKSLFTGKMSAKRIGVALAVALLFAFCLYTDYRVAEWCREHARAWSYNPWLDAFKQFGKSLAPVWLIAIWALLWGRKHVLVQVLIALVLTGILVASIKYSTQRLRPGYLLNEKRMAELDESGFGHLSFPSGDTASAFAIATVCAVNLTLPGQIIVFVTAAGVGVLRVVQSHHYPSDAVAGALLGVGCGALGLFLFRRYPVFPQLATKIKNGWLFALILIVPIGEMVLFPDDGSFPKFLPFFGPFLLFALLKVRGERWLGSFFQTWADSCVSRQKEIRRSATLMILFLGALAVLPNLGWNTLYDRDEGYYSECAVEMIRRGDPIVPHYNGEPWLEKPPLTMWAMALSILALGQTEFAARLPSALAGILAVWLTFNLGRRMYGVATGLCAAIVLLTAVMPAATMRFALLDTTLLCTVLASMTGLWMFIQAKDSPERTEEKNWGLVFFYVGCGLGMLAKGPLGLFLPPIALAGYLAISGRWKLITQMRPIAGALLALIVFGLWAVTATIATGGEYVRELVWVRTLEPVFSPLQGHGGGSLLEYLLLLPVYIPVLFIGLLPWSFLLPCAVHRSWNEEGAQRGAFLWGWGLSQLLVFSLVSTKLPHYILPLFPAVAIMLGNQVAYLIERSSQLEKLLIKRRNRIVVICAFTTAMAIPIAVLVAGFHWGWLAFLPLSFAVVAGTKDVLRRVDDQCPFGAFVALSAWCVMFYALLFQVAMPAIDMHKSAWRVADFVHTRYDEGQWNEIAIGVRGYKEVSLPFYLGREVTKLDSSAEVDDFLKSAMNSLVIIPLDQLEEDRAKDLTAGFQRLWQREVWIPEKGEWKELLIIGREG